MRGHFILLGSIALSLAGAAGAAAADESPICADRPGKSTATCTVSAGHLQIETGLADWSLQKAGGERDTLLVLDETTFKLGLTAASDIEVDVVPWQQARSRARDVRSTARGIGDLQLIYKRQLTGANSALQVALRPFVKIPTARRALGNGEWESGLVLPVGFAVPSTRLSVALTPELDWVADLDGNGHHLAMRQVASLGWQPTDRLNLSAELWGSWELDRAQATRQYSADGAVAYLLSNDVQLDAGADFGLNRETPDVELYAGISKRF